MNKPRQINLGKLNTTNHKKKRIKLAYFISISGVSLLHQTGGAGCGELLTTILSLKADA